MKIKGPGGPPRGLTPEGVAKGQPSAQVGKSTFADKLSKSGQTEATGGPRSLTGPTSASSAAPTSPSLLAIARDLRAGKLSRGEAVTRIVDTTIAEGPGRSLGPEQQAALRTHLERTLAEDPFLLEQVQHLGGAAASVAPATGPGTGADD